METNSFTPITGGLLYCVTGSIAATGAPEILRILVERKPFSEIHVVQTKSSKYFVRKEPLAILSGNPCISNFHRVSKGGISWHVELSRKCEIALVAPASANTIAKLAHGICDDSVTMALSVFRGPVVLAPAIHPSTMEKRVFMRNMNTLREDGYLFCGPVHGFSVSEQARGLGLGAMPSPHVVAAFIEHVALTGRTPFENEMLGQTKV